jgi:hypothetical protein
LVVKYEIFLYQLLAEQLAIDVQLWFRSMNCCVDIVLKEETMGTSITPRSVRKRQAYFCIVNDDEGDKGAHRSLL